MEEYGLYDHERVVSEIFDKVDDYNSIPERIPFKKFTINQVTENVREGSYARGSNA